MIAAPPVRRETIDFYERARPLVEQLRTMAMAWRETASPEEMPAALEAHSEFMWLALRVELRLSRSRRGEAP
jgi:hypothetical protein